VLQTRSSSLLLPSKERQYLFLVVDAHHADYEQLSALTARKRGIRGNVYVARIAIVHTHSTRQTQICDEASCESKSIFQGCPSEAETCSRQLAHIYISWLCANKYKICPCLLFFVSAHWRCNVSSQKCKRDELRRGTPLVCRGRGPRSDNIERALKPTVSIVARAQSWYSVWRASVANAPVSLSLGGGGRGLMSPNPSMGGIIRKKEIHKHNPSPSTSIDPKKALQ
jgi:hypothetical protein